MKLKAFINKLASVKLDTDSILKEASSIALDNIKARHGVYPSDTNWAQLKPATIKNKKTGNSPLLETGELRNSYKKQRINDLKYEVGSDNPKSVWMENGVVSKNIPKRQVVAPEAIKAEKYLQEITDKHLGKLFNLQ